MTNRYYVLKSAIFFCQTCHSVHQYCTWWWLGPSSVAPLTLTQSMSLLWPFSKFRSTGCNSSISESIRRSEKCWVGLFLWMRKPFTAPTHTSDVLEVRLKLYEGVCSRDGCLLTKSVLVPRTSFPCTVWLESCRNKVSNRNQLHRRSILDWTKGLVECHTPMSVRIELESKALSGSPWCNLSKSPVSLWWAAMIIPCHT